MLCCQHALWPCTDWTIDDPTHHHDEQVTSYCTATEMMGWTFGIHSSLSAAASVAEANLSHTVSTPMFVLPDKPTYIIRFCSALTAFDEKYSATDNLYNTFQAKAR